MNAPNLKILSNGPLKPVLPGLVEKFRQDTSIQAQLEFAPGPVIAGRVTDGEVADVLIIPPEENRELVDAGKLLSEGYEVVARIGIGIFVRDGAAVPDISSPAAFQRAILAADSVTYVNVGSGIVFRDLLMRLGLAEKLKDKLVGVQTGILLESIQSGTGNEIGAAPKSRIMDPAVTGLKLVGPLPAEYQYHSVLSAAVTRNAPSHDAALQFIQFLVTPESRTAIAAAGAL